MWYCPAQAVFERIVADPAQHDRVGQGGGSGEQAAASRGGSAAGRPGDRCVILLAKSDNLWRRLVKADDR